MTFIDFSGMSQVTSAMPSASMSNFKSLMAVCLSHRHSGTPRSGGPGIQKLAPCRGLDSGFAPAARPGMTA
jgi:hypothetical protein